MNAISKAYHIFCTQVKCALALHTASMLGADVIWSTPQTTVECVSFAYASQTNRMVTVGANGLVQVISTDDHIVVNSFMAVPAFRCHLSPNADRVIVETSNGVAVLATDDGRTLLNLNQIRTDLDQRRLSVSGDWTVLAGPVLGEPLIKIVSLEDGRTLRNLPTGAIDSSVFAMSSNGGAAVVVEERSKAYLIDLITEKSADVTRSATIQYAIFDRTSERVFILGDSSADLWKVADQSYIGKPTGIVGGGNFVDCCSFVLTDDFGLRLRVDRNEFNDLRGPTVGYLLEVGNPRTFPVYPLPFDSGCGGISHDKREVGILHSDGALTVWDPRGASASPADRISTGNPFPAEFDGRPVLPLLMSARYSADGRQVFTLRADDDSWSAKPLATFGSRDAKSGELQSHAGRWFPEYFVASTGGISRDGRSFWSFGRDISRGSLGSNQVYIQFATGGALKSVAAPIAGAISGSGMHFAWSESNLVHIATPSPVGAEQRTLPGAGFTVRALEFSADESSVIGAGDGGYIAQWDTMTGNLRWNFKAVDDDIVQLAIDRSGKLALLADAKGAIAASDTDSRRQYWKTTGDGFSVSKIVLSPDGRVFATVTTGNYLQQRVLASDRLLTSDRIEGSKISSIDYSPDGSALVIGQELTELRVMKLPLIIVSTIGSNGKLVIQWTGGRGPFKVQQSDNLAFGGWVDVAVDVQEHLLAVGLDGMAGYLRVISSE